MAVQVMVVRSYYKISGCEPSVMELVQNEIFSDVIILVHLCIRRVRGCST